MKLILLGILILFSLETYAIDPAARDFCAKLLAGKVDLKGIENQQAWNEHGFTHPSEHSPHEFSYIVHGIDFRTSVSPSIIDAPGWEFRRPRMLSLSLVNESFTETLHPFGLILQVPGESIVATSPRDFDTERSFFKTEKLAKKHNRQRPIMAPDELMEKALSEPLRAEKNHIEILILSNRQVQIQGLFLILENGESLAWGLARLKRRSPLNGEQLAEFIKYFQDRNLPIIGIPKASQGI